MVRQIRFEFSKAKGFHSGGAFGLLFLLGSIVSQAQQILWTKFYNLEKRDEIACIIQDSDHFMYAGGSSLGKPMITPGGTKYERAMVMKLDEMGDTVFVKYFDIAGKVYSMAMDPYGMLRVNIRQDFVGANTYNTFFLSMTTDGVVAQKDSIGKSWPYSCLIGKDSSLIVAGRIDLGLPSLHSSMYFQRITKEGIVEPWIELNPGHPNCAANRIEQLPNGHYLVSGIVGSRIASYELNEDGSNPVFKQWYQTPDLSNFSTGHVGRITGNRFMIGGQGNPSLVGQFDSTTNKYWLRKDVGIQVPPQAMTDGSTVFGYKTGAPLYQTLYRIGPDSSTIWFISLKDSLLARGLPGFCELTCFTFFEDESATLAGTYYYYGGVGNPNNSLDYDPIFLKISSIGTPSTTLLKPKKGPLANETLAPWPNPTSGTLYLKQHFDKAEIHVYNLAGKEMGNFQIGFAQPIDVSGYASGVYLYRAVIDGKFYSGKIIRN